MSKETSLQIVIVKNETGYRAIVMGLDDKGMGVTLRGSDIEGQSDVFEWLETELPLLRWPHGVTDAPPSEAAQLKDLMSHLIPMLERAPIKHPQEIQWRDAAKKIADSTN